RRRPAARRRDHRERHGPPAAARLARGPGQPRGQRRRDDIVIGTRWLSRRFEVRRVDAPRRPTRFQAHYDPHAFGRVSETGARFFGTARYLVFQTILVVLWITANILF